MKNRFNKPRMSIGTSHKAPLKRSSSPTPIIPVHAHEPSPRNVMPDDGQWDAVQLELPFVLEDGTILFWTALQADMEDEAKKK